MPSSPGLALACRGWCTLDAQDVVHLHQHLLPPEPPNTCFIIILIAILIAVLPLSHLLGADVQSSSYSPLATTR